VQPLALDRGHADRAAVALGDEDAPAEAPPTRPDSVVGVREVGGREDVRQRGDGRLALKGEVRLGLVRP
jgi:hypothetical protein